MEKEIFRAGTWTSSNGKSRKWTNKDLDTLATNFNSKKQQNAGGRFVPLTKGHPWDGAEPAYGWVKRVWREGKKLFAEFVDVADEMVEWLQKKTYRQVSSGIRLEPNLELDHVAVLGAVGPAVPGMGDWEFQEGVKYACYSHESADRKDVYVFDDESRLTTALKALKDLFNSDEDIPANFNINQGDNMADEHILQELSQAKEKITSFEEEIKTLKAENEALKTTVANMEQAAKDKEVAAADAADAQYTGELIKGNKVKPADKDNVLCTLKALRGTDAIKAYKSTLDNASPVVSNANYSNGNEPKKDDDKLDELVKAEQAKDPNLSYSQAASKVFAVHPELNK